MSPREDREREKCRLARIECEQRDGDADIEECDEFAEEDEQADALSLETSREAEERARQFATIAELLLATELGTS